MISSLRQMAPRWTQSDGGKVRWDGNWPSPFGLLRLHPVADLNTLEIEWNSETVSQLRTPDSWFYADLASARAVLLDPGTRMEAVAKFNSNPLEEVYIIYVTQVSHELEKTLPLSGVADLLPSFPIHGIPGYEQIWLRIEEQPLKDQGIPSKTQK
jgi:hypothetical protein